MDRRKARRCIREAADVAARGDPRRWPPHCIPYPLSEVWNDRIATREVASDELRRRLGRLPGPDEMPF